MTVVSNAEKSQQLVSETQYDVVVVGAGPYGLTAAAQLLGKGLKVAVFGKPLELWRNHMPEGMNLRSHLWATNLADPQHKYTFERFFKEKNYKKVYPVPAKYFIEYGLWFQKNAVPNLDETYVSSVERQNKRFVVTLEDGRVVYAPAVVMAVGVYYYANRPSEYDDFPAEYVSHSFEHANFDCFKDKSLLILGGGQSATENAALAHEAGADVHIVVRRKINWLSEDTLEDERSLLMKIKAPNAGIAPGWNSWVIEHVPYLFYRFPQEKKDRYTGSYYGPAAADWLRNRIVGKVHVYEGQTIKSMEVQDSGVDVTLSAGEKLHVDHVMLATGYRVGLKKLPILHPSLLAQIRTNDDTPVLDHWFESNVPGLYFIGLSSVRAFGPLYRFVLGATAAGRRVSSAVARYVRK
jgi:cation diffusion facilitator CzcD-associated flavoprotein CzcO